MPDWPLTVSLHSRKPRGGGTGGSSGGGGGGIGGMGSRDD